MKLQSVSETVLVEDGVVQLAFDLSDSSVAYLIISKPEDGAADEFFGADHYVEVKDQLHGQYGGLAGLAVLSDKAIAVRLAEDGPEVGQEISLMTSQSMSEQLLQHLRDLERW
jgi:hypothetical protein